jgi:glutamate N-acetyltransferase/amino-acid N-acetyltransferase
MEYEITPIKGGFENIDNIFFDGLNAGFKKDLLDIGFIYTPKPLDISSVFTTSKFKASPLLHYLQYSKDFKTNFILLNSKNANAMNGKKGIDDINIILDYLSTKTSIINPIMSSTGVIGQRLDIEKFKKAIDRFDFTKRDFDSCSNSILTTDKYTKTSTYEVKINNEKFTISAMAKGAGMINPSMATMLCFIATDADIPKSDMDSMLQEVVDETLNAISVDGDTSTNDSVMLFTTRGSKSYNKDAFYFVLKQILQEISMDILRDGEGSSKVVAFDIKGAKDDKQAQIIAKKLSNSLLVKTALFGSDPNWGRIGATIGASGCDCDESKLSIYYDDICVYDKGVNVFNKDIEERAYKILKKDSFKIICDMGINNGNFIAYGCDLGYDYVKLNAEYRT